MAWNKLVPFAGKDMLDYVDPGATQHFVGWNDNYTKRIDVPITWVDAETVFHAFLKLESYGRGRSAVRFHLKDEKTGNTYVSGIQHMFDAIVSRGVTVGGVIAGNWTFTKQGANYSLKPAP